MQLILHPVAIRLIHSTKYKTLSRDSGLAWVSYILNMNYCLSCLPQSGIYSFNWFSQLPKAVENHSCT